MNARLAHVVSGLARRGNPQPDQRARVGCRVAPCPAVPAGLRRKAAPEGTARSKWEDARRARKERRAERRSSRSHLASARLPARLPLASGVAQRLTRRPLRGGTRCFVRTDDPRGLRTSRPSTRPTASHRQDRGSSRSAAPRDRRCSLQLRQSPKSRMPLPPSCFPRST